MRLLSLCLSLQPTLSLSPTGTAEEYQELLPKEEEDLQEILTSHEDAIQDSEKLMEKISEELSTLDEVSVTQIKLQTSLWHSLSEQLSFQVAKYNIISSHLTHACRWGYISMNLFVGSFK